MIRKWDERLASLSADLDKLSKKAADASKDAKAARELREEVRKDRISTARGNVVALQERIRIANEEKKSKFNSSLLKAQMTVEEKIRQYREKRDKKQIEAYIDEQINYIYESFETAAYLISKAQLAILETVDAIDEYNEKYGTADDAQAEAEAPAEEAPAETETPAES